MTSQPLVEMRVHATHHACCQLLRLIQLSTSTCVAHAQQKITHSREFFHIFTQHCLRYDGLSSQHECCAVVRERLRAAVVVLERGQACVIFFIFVIGVSAYRSGARPQ